jgi:hypothetical protein
MSRKPGCIEPVIYFRFPNGHLLLAPYSSFPTPEFAIREYADTLAQVDRLEEALQRQELDRGEREMERDHTLIEAKSQEIRDRIYSRMTSGSTTEFEREFLRLYLQLRDERKREKYRQRYLEYSMYLSARHNDIGKGRHADSEEFNVEKHTVK